MFTLKYNDLTDNSTMTSKTFEANQRDIKLLEAKLKRMKDFDRAMTNYLQARGEMDYSIYYRAYILLENFDMTVPEIFEEVRKMG